VRLTVDTDARTLQVEDDGGSTVHDLYDTAALDALTALWVKVGWSLKYPYQFTWLGRPLIQLPDDVLAIQELVYQVRPTVIVETGVAHGGSLVLYASLLKALGGGRVVGVDIEIRPHNREAIESHFLADGIVLIEGDSVALDTVQRVRQHIGPEDRVLVILDSNHTREHVNAELDAYADLVSADSYIVSTDGVMEWVHDAPRGEAEWAADNPRTAALDFLARDDRFTLEDPPPRLFDETVPGVRRATHWPGAYLRRNR
jgi:cephalosporin hydroxylase